MAVMEQQRWCMTAVELKKKRLARHLGSFQTANHRLLPVEGFDRQILLVHLGSVHTVVTGCMRFLEHHKHQKRALTFPLGLLAFPGYKKIPPYISVRWTSATIEPM